MQAPKLTGQSFRTVLQHRLFLVECRSMPVAALWQLRCYTWQLTGEGLFTSAPALWLSPLPNSKEKMLLQAGSLENQRHLLPEAPSWVLSMGRRLEQKWKGEEARQALGAMCPQNCSAVSCPAPSLTALGEARQKGEYSDKHRLKRSVQSQEQGRREHPQPLLKLFLSGSVWLITTNVVCDLCHVHALDVTICLTMSYIHPLCFTMEGEVSKTLSGVQVYSSSVGVQGYSSSVLCSSVLCSMYRRV